MKAYVSSTRPGHRAPHVFLKDGKTSTVDLIAGQWTLVDFVDSCSDSTAVDGFVPMARKQFGIPLNHAVLRSEQAAHSIWGTNLALCRPDGHVAWRANTMPESAEARKEILATVTGYQIHEDYNKREMDEDRVRAKVGIATSFQTAVLAHDDDDDDDDDDKGV